MSTKSQPGTYGIVGKRRLMDGTLCPVLRVCDMSDPAAVAENARHYGQDYEVFQFGLSRRDASDLCLELEFVNSIIAADTVTP